MISVLSPAKTLDMESPACVKTFTEPDFLHDSEELVKVLRGKSPKQIGELMNLSEKLADLNAARFSEWDKAFSPDNAKACVLAFKGDVYQGLQAETFKKADFTFAQKHLRILSGLYGILRPLDLMQAYRLEMGTDLKNKRGKNLYDFWGSSITESLNQSLASSKSSVVLNLASQEYFKSVKPKALDAEIVVPVFKDLKNGKYKMISFYAKQARGMMAAFAIRNRIKKVDDLKTFSSSGYAYCEAESDDKSLVFLRDEPQPIWR